MQEDLINSLKKAGFREKEAFVYAYLANSGGTFPSNIAEKTKINRTTVYKILLDLSVRGLISEVEKRGKLFYQIENPSKLTKYAKDKIKIAENELEEIAKITPDLEGLFSSVKNKPKVKFFEGPDTVWTICQDMVSGNEKYEMLAFSHADKFKNYLEPSKLRSFVKEKERLGITTRAIVPDTEISRGYNSNVFEGLNKDIWPVIRFIKPELFPYEAEITIYGNNKVSITKLSKENVIGIIIEDSIIHGMMKMIFELSWKGADFYEKQKEE